MVEQKFPQVLDTNKLSEEARLFERHLLSRIIGQERAIKNFVSVYQQIEAGMIKPKRPCGVFLFLGPTGTGKTELCREAAQFLLGNKEAITRIDCGEFQRGHEVAKLIGSPPGYLGFNDRSNIRLTQEKLDKFQTPQHKINFLLFDEIEEAHDEVFSCILQILDVGRLTLGTGDETDFTKTIVIMTSNLGERETQNILQGKDLGLTPPSHDERKDMDEEVYKKSKLAATKHFKPKFMNRIDRIIVFRSLSHESLGKILQKELNDLELRVWGTAYEKWKLAGSEGVPPQFRVIFKTTQSANEFLLKEGTSQIYGARELNRAVERFVSFPLGSLIGSAQLEHGDVLEIDYVEGAKDLVFTKIAHRDLRPVPALEESVPTKCPHGWPPANCAECSPPPSLPWTRRPWKAK